MGSVLQIVGRNSSTLRLTGQPERLDSRRESCWLRGLQFRGAAWAEDFSARLLQRGGDAFAFVAANVFARHQSWRIQRWETRRRRRNFGNGRGHEFEAQWSALRKNYRALDCVLKFTHVARPVIGEQAVHCRLRQASGRTVHPLRTFLDEMGNHRHQILALVTQRWNLNWEDAKAIVEILAKSAGLAFLFQVAVELSDPECIGLC